VRALPIAHDVTQLEYCNCPPTHTTVLRPPRLVNINQSGGTYGTACSAAYVLTRRGASMLRAVQTPIRFKSDDAFSVAAGDGNNILWKRRPEGNKPPERALTMRRAFVAPPLAWQDRSATLLHDEGSLHTGQYRETTPYAQGCDNAGESSIMTLVTSI